MSELFVKEQGDAPCFRCASHKGPVVDFCITHTVEGGLYLCLTCLRSVCKAANFPTPEEFARLEALLNDSLERHDERDREDAERRALLVSEFADFVGKREKKEVAA